MDTEDNRIFVSVDLLEGETYTERALIDVGAMCSILREDCVPKEALLKIKLVEPTYHQYLNPMHRSIAQTPNVSTLGGHAVAPGDRGTGGDSVTQAESLSLSESLSH